jgi:hypothetical protein
MFSTATDRLSKLEVAEVAGIIDKTCMHFFNSATNRPAGYLGKPDF